MTAKDLAMKPITLFSWGYWGWGTSTKQLDGTSVAAVPAEVKDHFWGVNSNDVPQTPNL